MVAARGANDLAHRLGQYVHRVFIHARACGLVERIYSDYLAKSLEPVQTSHYKTIIDPVEIGHLLRAIDTYNGYPNVAYALKIMPYVFVRSRELRGALWEEIDFTSATWTIPESRMKMKKPHIVPLSKQVIKLLTALREYSTGDLLFPSPNNSSRCISDMSLLNGLRRLGYTKEQMTIHGFRAMASTLLNEQGNKPDVVERQLSHCEKDGVRRAYDHSQYLPERKKMMCAWADFLDGLRNPT